LGTSSPTDCAAALGTCPRTCNYMRHNLPTPTRSKRNGNGWRFSCRKPLGGIHPLDTFGMLLRIFYMKQLLINRLTESILPNDISLWETPRCFPKSDQLQPFRACSVRGRVGVIEFTGYKLHRCLALSPPSSSGATGGEVERVVGEIHLLPLFLPQQALCYFLRGRPGGARHRWSPVGSVRLANETPLARMPTSEVMINTSDQLPSVWEYCCGGEGTTTLLSSALSLTPRPIVCPTNSVGQPITTTLLI
jgi:hypothetical protein